MSATRAVYVLVAAAALALSVLACGWSGGPADGGSVDYGEELVVPAGAVTGDWDGFGNFDIEGTVTNIGEHRWEYVQVSAVVYDQRGDVVGADFTYTTPEHIDPGDKTVFMLWVDDEGHEAKQYEVWVSDAKLGN